MDINARAPDFDGWMGPARTTVGESGEVIHVDFKRRQRIP
jgi:hypothetical protein